MIGQTIAVIGASADRSKFGNKCVRAYLLRGWDVIPVHPSADLIEGLPVVASAGDLPERHIDRVSLYLPASPALGVLDQLRGKSIGQLWLNPGADSPEVVFHARELGLPVICCCSIVDIGVSPSTLG